MNILHIGFPNVALSKAFRSVSTVYNFIDWQEYGPFPNTNQYLNDAIRSLAVNADLVFFQIQTANVITPELFKDTDAFKDTNVINWTWDYHGHTPQWMVDISPYVISAFTNKTDVEYLRGLDRTAIYLQSGFDDVIYNKKGPVMSDAPDIVFMANNYPVEDHNFPLARCRKNMVDFLSGQYGDAFGVYGFGWPYQSPLKNFMHREEKEAACYRGCKIGINLSHFNAPGYTSDRIFRIMGSGALCLSHRYPEIEKDFTDNVHLRIWDSFDQLKELIDHYRIEISDRNRIAQNGFDLVHGNYTWSNMIDQVCGI